MASAIENAKVWLCIVAVLIVCLQPAAASHSTARRALRSWVATSGSVTVETGLIPPHPFKSTTEWTFNKKAAPPEEAEEPAAEEPAAEKESASAPAEEGSASKKGPGIAASFNKKAELSVEHAKPLSSGTKAVLVKQQPGAEVSVSVDKQSAKSSATATASASKP